MGAASRVAQRCRRDARTREVARRAAERRDGARRDDAARARDRDRDAIARRAGELYKFGTLQWNKRYFVLDEAGSIIFYWSDAAKFAASDTPKGAIHLFTVDSVELVPGPPSRAPSGLAGALTLRLRDGHSDASTVTLAAETLTVLERWRDVVVAHAQAVPAAQRALECVSALRLASQAPQRQGWLWKKRDVWDGFNRRWFVVTFGRFLSYYSTFDADTPTKVVDLRRCVLRAHEVASPSGAAGCSFALEALELGKTWVLATDEATEADGWKAILQAACAPTEGAAAEEEATAQLDPQRRSFSAAAPPRRGGGTAPTAAARSSRCGAMARVGFARGRSPMRSCCHYGRPRARRRSSPRCPSPAAASTC